VHHNTNMEAQQISYPSTSVV